MTCMLQVWRDTNSVTVNIELATPIPAHSFIRWQDTQHAISAASPLLLAHCTPDPQQSQHSFVSLASMTSMQLRAPSPPPLHALQAPATQPAQGIPPPMPMQHPRRSVAFASFSPAWHFSPAGGGLPPPEGLGSSHVELLVILDLAGAMSVAAIQCMAQAVQVLLQDMPVVAAPSGASFNVMLLPGAAPHATRASRSPVRSPSQSLNKATGSKNSGVNFAAPGEGEQAEGGEALISRKESVSFGTEFGPMPALEADQENAVHKEPSVEMPEPIALFSSGCQPHSISAVQDAVTFLQSQVLSADAEVLGSWAQPRSQVAHLLAQLCEEDADENGTRRAVLLFAAAGAVYQPGVDPKGRDDPLATHLSTRTNRMRLMRDSTVMSCMLAQSGGAPPPKAISTPWLDACVFIVAYGHTPEVAERERVSLFSTMAGTGGPALSPHGSTGHGAGNTAPDCAAQRQASTTGQPRGNAMQYLGLDHTSQGPSFSTSILQRNFSTVMRDDLKGTVFIRPAPSADLEYLDTLARCHAGFYAESKDQADIVASAHLALRCALSGRYLRDPWLSARGAIVRGMHPTPLPQALPLSDQLQLLVRLACLAPGAALQLHGLLPDGCEVVLGQSLEPKDSKMAGCMLPIMQALT